MIRFDKWVPDPHDPRREKYTGQRAAQEVFGDLKYRLASTGYLPDEYLLLDTYWENGREIPPDADVFCSVDYGASEGIYLDAYLKWFESGKPVTRSFFTGKTLGECGSDLDRMFLIASAITKALHGDHATHARYIEIGGTEKDSGGQVIHLSQQEEMVIVNALLAQRERQEAAMSRTEQLLRRMAGSITAYMDTVGQQPLQITDYDRTVLAIRDGELPTFRKLYPEVMESHADELLIEAAGRPGAAGRQMTALLLESKKQFSEPAYRSACQRAIGIDDLQKVSLLLEKANHLVPELPPSFHGEMASCAYMDHRFIAVEIIRQCTEDQIAAAPSRLLEQFAMDKNWRVLSMLVEKGISGGSSAARTLHMLTYCNQDRWIAEELLRKRMWVDIWDYGALSACIQNDAVDVATLLLDGGMDYDGFQQWSSLHGVISGHEETLRALAEHWQEREALQTQAEQRKGNQEEDAIYESKNFV